MQGSENSRYSSPAAQRLELRIHRSFSFLPQFLSLAPGIQPDEAPAVGECAMHVLVVEDNRINLSVFEKLLARLPECRVQGFDDPGKALAECARTEFDLVLIDYMMPGIDGVSFIRRLRAEARYAHVPIVMITAEADPGLKLEAIRAGATDFLNKPVDPNELRVRATNLLSLRKAQLVLADRARWLAEEVEKATSRLLAQEEEIIWRLARAIEFRDGGTGEHIFRVAAISKVLAETLGLEPARVRNIYLAAPLHDVGKIGISDAILNKPGRLTDDEMRVMRGHVNIGAAILADASSDLLRVAAVIAQTHHERWDGTGYPNRLAGEAIPIEGRIAALADAFDALCTARPYKEAWSLAAARAEIRACSGTHLDPACVAAFERAWNRIVAIMEAKLPRSAA
jgi:putative two-component system response regulator